MQHAILENFSDDGHQEPFETVFVAVASTRRFEFADGGRRPVPLEVPGEVWAGVLEGGASLGAYKDATLALLDRQTHRWRSLSSPEAASGNLISEEPFGSAAGPAGHVFISGYAHADHPGHTTVRDTEVGFPLALTLLAPGRGGDGLGPWTPHHAPVSVPR